MALDAPEQNLLIFSSEWNSEKTLDIGARSPLTAHEISLTTASLSPPQSKVCVPQNLSLDLKLVYYVPVNLDMLRRSHTPQVPSKASCSFWSGEGGGVQVWSPKVDIVTYEKIEVTFLGLFGHTPVIETDSRNPYFFLLALFFAGTGSFQRDNWPSPPAECE